MENAIENAIAILEERRGQIDQAIAAMRSLQGLGPLQAATDAPKTHPAEAKPRRVYRPRQPQAIEPDAENPAPITPAPGPQAGVACLDCGKRFKNAHGLGIHRTLKHFQKQSLTGSSLAAVI